jgi:pimeloyl-ACP methyl ester carboxylesterase
MRIVPERVTRLCLMDTSARPDTAEQALRRRRLIAASGGTGAAETRFRGVTPRLLPSLVHRDRLTDAPLVDAVMGMAERVGREAFLRQQTAIMHRPDSRPLLPGIRVPTLVAAGREDILTPPDHAAEMQALIPGAGLHLIDACGHLAPMERPDEVSAMLKSWLVGGV